MKEGFIKSKDNLRLFWQSHGPASVAPKAQIFLLHGYAEHLGRHLELAESLSGEGYSVHALDCRGHGQSDGRRGHCDDFSEYVDDFDLFWSKQESALSIPRFVFGHSHGSLVLLEWLRTRQRVLSGAIFASPYLQLAFRPPAHKLLAAKIVGRLVPWLPFGNELKPEDLTRDVIEQEKAAADPLNNQVTTPRWFLESSRAQKQVIASASEFHQPMMLFCGSEDPIAAPSATETFFQSLGSPDKTFKLYAGMRHETLKEIGKEEVYGDVSNWISARL